LREREPKLTPAGGDPIHRADPRDWPPGRWALVAGLAVAAASVALVLGGRDAERPRRPALDLKQAAPVPEPTARPATIPKTPAAGEPPRAPGQRWRPWPPPAPPPGGRAPPGAGAAPAASPPVTGPAVAAPTPEAAAVPATPRVTAGPEPAVRLRSIAYVTEPAQRTATLTIDGAPAVTLRQGRCPGGVRAPPHPRQ